MSKPPLWEVMRDAYCEGSQPGLCAHGFAAEIRAIVDEMVMQFDPWLAEHAAVAEWLTTEADRAERGEAIAAELEGAHAEPPRRQVFPTPHQIAECGGPCEQGGPEACDCGLYERSSTSSTR